MIRCFSRLARIIDCVFRLTTSAGRPMSDAIKSVTETTFETDVLASPLPVLVDYWAEWCGPCKMISPMLDESAASYAGQLNVAKINVDENPKIAEPVPRAQHPDADAVQGRPAGRHQGGRAEQVAARGVHRCQLVTTLSCLRRREPRRVDRLSEPAPRTTALQRRRGRGRGGVRDPAAAEPAVAVRVLREVLLVVVLGVVERRRVARSRS